MHKILVSLFFCTMVIACAGKESKKSATPPDGEAIFKKNCILCHGVNGKLGLNGAKDITVSKLTVEERMEQIKKGKNTMTPFETILTPEEIKAVADYTLTLK